MTTYVNANAKGIFETGRIYNGPQRIAYEVSNVVYDSEEDVFEVVVIFDDKSRNIRGEVDYCDFVGMEFTKRDIENYVLTCYDCGDYVELV